LNLANIIFTLKLLQKCEQEPCYRRDHRAMRPIYECPDNNVSAKLADDCARIST